MANINDEEKERTLWCGNLHPKVTEEILYELFLQAGPLEKVKLVKNKSYAFITFKHAISVPYTIQLMNGIQLYHKPIQLQTRTGTTNSLCQTPTPNAIPFPPVFNPLMSAVASNGSRFMPTPPASPAVALNPSTQESTTLTFHRSLSQPNFTNSQISSSELCLKPADVPRGAPGKMQPALHITNQRPNLPYTRSTGYNQRFDRSVQNNNVINQFSHQMLNFQLNGVAAVPWLNRQLSHQRRY